MYSPENVNETTIYKDALEQYGMDLVEYLESEYKSLRYINSTIIGPCPPGNEPVRCNLCDDLYCQINKECDMDDHIFYVIIGIMHTNDDIKQTTYSAITYQPLLRKGVDPHINCFEYNGSGLILPVKTSVDKELLKDIFVVQLTDKNNCDLIEYDLPGLCIDGIEIYDGSVVVIRNYLNPITKTSPIAMEIVASIMLRFHKI